MHEVILERLGMRTAPGFMIEHIDGNGFNNCRNNLRIVPKTESVPEKSISKPFVRAIGFNLGLRGDILMSTVAARSFKQEYSNSHLTLGVASQFKDLLPLFHDHPYFDSNHVYESYDNWPSPRDMEYIKSVGFNFAFDGKPMHRDGKWWELRHQYAEAAHMVGLNVPDDIRPTMNRWFNISSRPDTIALAPFGGNGGVNDKALSIVQAQGIVDWLLAHRWKVVHLGAPNEPDLVGAPRPRLSYFDAVRLMLGCRALIHCDTGMGHFAGAYGHPSFGIYGYRYFGAQYISRIQPLHQDFYACNGETVAGQSVESIVDHLKEFLG
jgi:ADP-heptose:LPS heptosyltransferase